MIITNRDQRPKRYAYEASDVADMVGCAVTLGRIRQLARGFGGSGEPIGWMQFKANVPDDGEFQLPFPVKHKYSYDDVLKMIEWVQKCKKHDGRYSIKINRWYSQADISKLIARSKRLKKKKIEGEVKATSSHRSNVKKKIA